MKVKKTSTHTKAVASRETSRNVPQNLDPNYQKLVEENEEKDVVKYAAERKENMTEEERGRLDKSMRIGKLSEILFTAMNAISLMILSREDRVPQDPVFLLNLNHGIVPLKYVKGLKHPIQMIEYNSNVLLHTKILKASMGACPMSNVNSHKDLVQRLSIGMNISISGVGIPKSADFNANVLSIISNPVIPENSDIRVFHPAWHYRKDRNLTTRYIAKHATETYQTIVIRQTESTVNKFFFMEKTEKDGGIYVLLPARVLLPFTTIITQFTHQHVIDNPMTLCFAGYYTFTSTCEMTVIHPDGTREHCATGSSIILYMGSYIDDVTPDNVGCILSHFSHMNIFLKNGYYTLYPYETGTKVVEHGVEYVGYIAWTDVLSCPYFIDYFQQMIQNPTTTRGLELFEDDFISTCTSLRHPYLHETVMAISSIILTNYFRNSSHLYTYDFTCQAFELVDYGGSRDALETILFRHKGNQEALYKYAKGITKRKKRKPKKTIKKRKRH